MLKKDFQIDDTVLEGVEILLASYGEDYGYDGAAFVLFRKGGALYEVNGSHCSCYGLEDQWKPEETTIAALRSRLDAGQFGRTGASPFADELITVLDELGHATP